MAENTKIIISAVDKTKKGFGSVTSGLKKVTGAVFSMRTALVGVAGVAGFGLLIKSSLNSIDSLAKTASKIGTTTEALSGLRFAAELTGVATTTMDMALQRFTRRTAEAAKGTGEAKDALKTLGVNALELINMPLDQRMLVLADAFKKQTNEAEKLALAFKLFDSEGAALVNTLSLGREGLAELLGEAKALGIVMSSDAAEGVEDAVDSLTKLKTLFKGVTQQLAAGLAPAIESIAKLLTKRLKGAIDEAGGSVEEFGRVMAIDFIEAAKTVVTAGAAIANGVIRTYNAMIKAKSTYDSLMGNSSTADALQRDLDIINEMIESSNPFSRMRFDLSNIFSMGVEGSGLDGIFSDKELADKKLKIMLALKDLKTVGKESALIKLFDPKDILSGLSIAQVAVKDYTRAVDALGNVNENSAESLSVYQRSVAALKLTFEDFKKTLPTLEEGITSLTNNAMGAFTKGFTDAITGAEKFSDAMKTMAKSVIDSLIQMLVQYYITQQIFGAITSMFPTGGGNANAGGFAAGTNLGGSMSMDGGGFTGRGSRSGGVDGKGGFPAILHPNETVIDHTKNINKKRNERKNTNEENNSIVVNQTINVTTGVQQTVRAEIVQLMPQIAQAAKGAVADARLRGGNFSKAMGGA